MMDFQARYRLMASSQVLQSGVVSRQEGKGVPEQTRSIASRFQYGLGGGDCATVGCSFPCMGVTGTKHH